MTTHQASSHAESARQSAALLADTPPPQSPDRAEHDRTSARRLDVQGLRAVAILVVVAFHAGLPIPGGFVGVDVFFVISGFVITAMLLREWSSNGRVRFGAFYLRRFKRLTPALALMITVTLLLSAVILSPLGPQQVTAETAIGAMALVANVVIAMSTGGYFGSDADLNPLLHTWSLSVEEQFYLFFPIALVLGFHLARRVRALRATPLAIVTTIGVLSFGLALAGSQGIGMPGMPPQLLGFYSPLSRVWEFAAGAALALATRRLPARYSAVTAAVGTLMLAGSLVLITETTPFPGPATLLPVVGTVLLIHAGTSAATNPMSRALSARPMVLVGDLSYSWYLWHWPLIVFASLLWPGNLAAPAAAAVLALAPAMASYRWVEQPIRRLSRIPRPRIPRIAALTLAAPVVTAALLLYSVSNGYWNTAVSEYQAAVVPRHAGHLENCDTGLGTGTECVWNREAPGAPIYLVGDSHADHLSEAVISAGSRLGRPVTIVTRPNCPFVDLVVQRADTSQFNNASCRNYVERTLDTLSRETPATVVVAFLDSYFWDPSVAVGIPGGPMTEDAEAKPSLLKAGLTATAARLSGAGHDVLIVQDVPSFDSPVRWSPERCTTWAIVEGKCVAQVDEAAADAIQAPVRAAIFETEPQPGVSVIDIRDFFCRDGACFTALDGLVLYRDTDHISVPASVALADRFTAGLDSGPRLGAAND